MCGINGILNAPEPCGPALERMNARIAHRGPDATGVFTGRVAGREVGFGHARLAIIELRDCGNQPFHDPAGRFTLVFNGEIYNYRELRAELAASGAAFRTDSDTEVLLESFRRYGPDCVRRFNGMWAFAMLDRVGRTVTLSRDRFGEKPLYYRFVGDALHFSSECKALLASGGPSAVDPLAANDFLRNDLLDASDRTFYRDIRQLPAAHIATVDLARDRPALDLRRYWAIPDPPASAAPTPREAGAHLLGVLRDSVRLRLRSDVPLGVLLSGGLDSSTIAALADEGGVRPGMLSVVSDDPASSEEPFIDAAAAHLRVAPEKFNADRAPEELFDLAPRLTWHHDEPLKSLSAVAHSELIRGARARGYKVLLSGQGGDETLCGYKKYFFYRFRELAAARRPLALASEFAPWLLRSGTSENLRLTEARRYLPAFLRRFDPGVDPRGAALRRYDEYRTDLARATPVRERQLLDLFRYSVPCLNHMEDRMSMAHALEIRLPFLDHRFVEAALALPVEYRLRHGWTKWILRDATAGLIPDAIRFRRDKRGYTIPHDAWFRGALRPRIDRMIRGDMRAYDADLLHPGALRELWRRYLAGRSVWFKEIMNPLALEWWLEAYGGEISR